jgi:GNAT superfamily N-acetyltransferase
VTLTILPANEVSWDDLQKVFGFRGDASHCQCQRYKIGGRVWDSIPDEARAAMLRAETNCGDPAAPATTGLVAFLDGEPVGWCALEPRTAYPRLRTTRVPWTGRDEDRDDASVWAVTCFAVRAGYRRQGISRVLAAATVEHARRAGARVVEAYPMATRPGEEITWGELHVGSRSVFADAGYEEVAHPTPRRYVMRVVL